MSDLLQSVMLNDDFLLDLQYYYVRLNQGKPLLTILDEINDAHELIAEGKEDNNHPYMKFLDVASPQEFREALWDEIVNFSQPLVRPMLTQAKTEMERMMLDPMTLMQQSTASSPEAESNPGNTPSDN